MHNVTETTRLIRDGAFLLTLLVLLFEEVPVKWVKPTHPKDLCRICIKLDSGEILGQAKSLVRTYNWAASHVVTTKLRSCVKVEVDVLGR